MRENKVSLKSVVMDFCESMNRPMNWTELKEFMMAVKHGVSYNQGIEKYATRGYYSSYFSDKPDWSKSESYFNREYKPGTLMGPSRKEPRFLVKNSQGKYELAK